MTTEEPRLSGMLRAFLSSAPVEDFQQLYLRRQEKLKLRVKAQTTGAGKFDSLSWQYFNQLLGDREREQAKKLRATYNLFLNNVREIIGNDEIPSEELHVAARVAYNICNTPTSNDHTKRKNLKAEFPAFEEKFLIPIQTAAAQLFEWRSARVGQNEENQVSAASQQTRGIIVTEVIADREWGASDWDHSFDVVEADESAQFLDEIQDFASLAEVDDYDDALDDLSGETIADIDWSQANLEPLDTDWLRNQCTRFATGSGSPMHPTELASSITAYLLSSKTDLELQEQLFNFLGYASIEFVELLLKNRMRLVALAANRPGGPGSGIAAPSSSFIIQTKQDKLLEKLQRKEMQKLRKLKTNAGGRMDSPYIDLNDTRALAEKRAQQLAKEPELNLREASNREAPTAWSMKALPAGTVRRDQKSHEAVYVPAPPKPTLPEGEKLVVVDEAFDDFAKLAFQGITTLNRIQSRVYETAYHSNENMLICAPTGAGKTNVALMTMLHEIGEHFSPSGVLRRDEFKIVYVAPMKALAAEMAANFAKRFLPLNLQVKELTGDMQLTKKEIQETQVIVTTPEKWDVITRKSTDNALAQQVRLLIIDEVHLLHEDRGSVIESLVARTLRQVEQTQAMIRIVGLSATLPNYRDVAHFLRVNPTSGLFYFDSAYRPVPMSQEFVGVKTKDPMKAKTQMAELCFDRIKASLQKGYQCMVFVHSRKDTYTTAKQLLDIARNRGLGEIFLQKEKDIRSEPYLSYMKEVAKSKSREVRELFPDGFGVHHAGMLRPDRSLTEKMFEQGCIKVLVCTATLAWGVNLPAHTVIIKGTQIYNPEKGSFVDLGMLDVMQIFGRAGRPQYGTSGEGVILTTHDKLHHYLNLLCHQMPIESTFTSRLADHLNAEIVLGTVTSIQDAVQWLSYTYLHVRMMKNPLAYGITYQQKEMDPELIRHKAELIRVAARTLDKCKMIRFDERLGALYPTDLGRVASHYYIQYGTIETFNRMLKPTLSDADIFNLAAQSAEFENIVIRDEEMEDLDRLETESCRLDVKGGVENKEGKINILLQSYISQARIDAFSLVSDMSYVAQSAGRIFRALFEITAKNNWPRLATKLLGLTKMVDKRIWSSYHPLRQFPSNSISPTILQKLEEKRLSIDRIRSMSADELAGITHANKIIGRKVLNAAQMFPRLEVEASVQPITRTVLKVQLTLTADFIWNERIHGTVEPFWIWIEDAESEYIYHSEYYLLHKKQKDEPQKLNFIIPIFADPLPAQYFIHIQSDRWLGSEMVETLSFKHLILPQEHPPHTELLPLQPLPVKALKNPLFESLYGFSHFNPIQTQTFHVLHHTDSNVLVGAPTGSGKTIMAELAALKVFRDTPHLKVVYIAPLKALVRERKKDWTKKFVGKLGKKMVELTGDYTPDLQMLQAAEIITTTPEKWDGISRNWQNRSYVKQVGLIIIDEIHLLGEERGPILEVIVSRMRYVGSAVGVPIRMIGLSTAMANAIDLADWLGIDPVVGLYNFRPSVRPVPLEAHIAGFRGKNYCPRMQTMNKPAYQSIKTHSPDQPVLVFVSSRRQTRLTAMDLINFCASEGEPTQFLHMSPEELEVVLMQIRDSSLKNTLQFGIGLHHAGLPETDKSIVEDLFASNKIQVLVSTATLAWGVNLPAHLVVVKGTEFYDPKTKRYQDYPITDVLQMMGRAGRPQFDNQGVAYIMVEESKKPFYKKFLYDPFPVESSLSEHLHDHINAEIVSGTIGSKQDAIDYITWTYYFRRLLKNPTYYQLEDVASDNVNKHLSGMLDAVLQDLQMAECVELPDALELAGKVLPTTLGRIASYYYLRYGTVQIFARGIKEDSSVEDLLKVLCDTHEYIDHPVRHNEDQLNIDLIDRVRWPSDKRDSESPHLKANLLLQCHYSALTLPITDYYSDTKSVLDQSVRIVQAMVDVAADRGYLQTCLSIITIMQMNLQGVWYDDSPLLTLPHFREKVFEYAEHDGTFAKPPAPRPGNVIAKLAALGVQSLPDLMSLDRNSVRGTLESSGFSKRQISEVTDVLSILPQIDVRWKAPENLYADDPNSTEATMSEVKVQLIRRSKDPKEGIYAPRFPKFKDEGWWLILGDEATGELVALRRINFHMRSTTNLGFPVPTEAGVYKYTLFLMSDSYLGVDQQSNITIEVKSREAQVIIAKDVGAASKKIKSQGPDASGQPSALPAAEEEDFWGDDAS